MHIFTHKYKTPRNYRRWINFNNKDGYKLFGISYEISWAKKGLVGIGVSFGNRGSETPFDFYIGVGVVALFIGISSMRLGRILDKIGGGVSHKISLRVFDKSLWWEFWYCDNDWRPNSHRCDLWRPFKIWPLTKLPKQYRPWRCLRNGHIPLNPLDTVWGEPKYNHVPIGPKTTTQIHLNDGYSYMIEVTASVGELRRQRGPKFARRVLNTHRMFDWDSSVGIPYYVNVDIRRNHVRGSAVTVDQFEPDWVLQAQRVITEDIQKRREKNNQKDMCRD